MDHEYPERMPRACKRGRKTQTDPSASTSGRGRRTRAAAMAQMLQSTGAYGAQAPVPDLPAAAYPHPEMDSAQHMMQHSQYSASYQRSQIQAAAELKKRQGSRYYTRAQERAAPYMRPDPNISQSTSNQILYPNMVNPRTTATYTATEQLPHMTTMAEHTFRSRYNTRSAVHNLPLPTAPSMGQYWNYGAGHSSSTAMTTNTNSHNANAPVMCSKQTENQTTQTELILTDSDVKLVKTLRTKKMDPEKFNTILENDDYIVTYTQPERDNSMVRQEALNSIIKNSEQIKNVMVLCYSTAYRQLVARFSAAARRQQAIQYPDAQPSTSTSEPQTQVMHMLPTSALQTPQEAQVEPVPAEEIVDNVTQEANQPNEAFVANVDNVMPTEPQVPQQRARSPNVQNTFSIPTIFNQSLNYYNEYNRLMQQSLHGHHEPIAHNSRSSAPSFNLPYNFLENIRLPNNMFMDSRFFQQPPPPPTPPHDFDHFGWL